VNLGDFFSGVVEHVDVENVSAKGDIFNGIRQLDLPFDSSLWLPDGCVTDFGASPQDGILNGADWKLCPGVQAEYKQDEAKKTKGQGLAPEKEDSPARVARERHCKNGVKSVQGVKTSSRECNEQLGPAKCLKKGATK
jgi:hypothetical protein